MDRMDISFDLEWALGDFTMQERKQWRGDRFKEWFLSDFQPDHPQLLTQEQAESQVSAAYGLALREHLIGRGVFIIERNGRPGRSRM